MENRRERMAVIGAGPVGLGIAKALKQHGIAYDQCDDDDLGAKWLLPIFLPRAERRLRRKIVRQTPPFASEAPLAWPNADLTVY
jgi:cation diffusion facilitator CzcD-associated flavoprotein CzcO